MHSFEIFCVFTSHRADTLLIYFISRDEQWEIRLLWFIGKTASISTKGMKTSIYEYFIILFIHDLPFPKGKTHYISSYYCFFPRTDVLKIER